MVFAAVTFLIPQISRAQGVLPIQWLYSPITTPNGLVYSPDGTKLVVGGGGSGGGIQIYSVSGGTLACLPTSATFGVYSVAFSPDGSTLAVGGANSSSGGLVEFWNIVTKKLIGTLATSANYRVTSIAYSPDGSTLAVGGQAEDHTGVQSGVLELWNLSTSTRISNLNTAATFEVNSVSITPDGMTLIDGGDSDSGSVLELWNVSTGALIKRPNSASNLSVNGIACSPDGKTFAVGGNAISSGAQVGSLEVWSLTTNARLSVLNTGASYSVNSVTFSSDGKLLAAGGQTLNQGVLELWTVSSNTLAKTIPTVTTGVNCCAFSRDGKTIADGGQDLNGTPVYGAVETWNISSGSSSGSANTGTYTDVGSIAYSPDGTILADGGSSRSTGVLELWNVGSGQLTSTLNTAATGGVTSVAFSPDGGTLVDGGVGISGAVLELWNVATGKLNFSLATSANKSISAVAFSPDGKLVVCGGRSFSHSTASFSGVLELWNPLTGTRTASLNTAANGGVLTVAFSPDGKTLIAGGTGSSGGVLEEWDVASGKLTSTLVTAANNGVTTVVFSRDGKNFAVGGYNTSGQENGVVELWQSSNFTRITALNQGAEQGVLSVAFSADGKYLFAGTSGYLQTFSLTTNSLLEQYNVAQVSSVAVSPNGVQLAFGTENGEIAVATIPTYTSVVVSSLAFNPSTIIGGNPVTATVTIAQPAPVGGVFVSVTANTTDVTVPATANIPGGSTTATFSVETKGVATQSTATITAGNSSASKSVALTITPAGILSFSVSPTSVTGGLTSVGTITLNGKAGTGGTSVTLTSSNSAVVPPKTVVVPAGKGAVSFSLATIAVSASKVVTVTAKIGSTSKTASLTVQPPSLSSVTLTPSAITGGSSVTGSVILSSPAGVGGVVVTLSSSSKSATVPVSLTVAANQASATFIVKTTAVSAQTLATVTGKLGGAVQSATVTIGAPDLNSFYLNPVTVKGGKTSTGVVGVSAPAPAGGLKVVLTSSLKSATVPATVLIPAGKSSVTFSIKTTAVKTAANSTITVSFGGATKTAVLTIN